jgi:hypothetical protein
VLGFLTGPPARAARFERSNEHENGLKVTFQAYFSLDSALREMME